MKVAASKEIVNQKILELLCIIIDLVMHLNRGVEIVKFSTCPGASKWPLCTCAKKILLVRWYRLANTFLCLNNLHFRKQYETMQISTLV